MLQPKVIENVRQHFKYIYLGKINDILKSSNNSYIFLKELHVIEQANLLKRKKKKLNIK